MGELNQKSACCASLRAQVQSPEVILKAMLAIVCFLIPNAGDVGRNRWITESHRLGSLAL